MCADGMNVLIEGRAQTLNFIRTPHRFELTLAEPTVIGQRRAAQRVMANAIKAFEQKAAAEPTAEAVHAVLHAELKRIAVAV